MNNSELIDQEAPLGKVFKEKTITTATFLGGPLAAGYILAENFKTLGQNHKVAPTWILAILATVAIFVGVFFIPEDVNIPNMLIPLAYTGIAYIIFRSSQTDQVLQHLEKGGKSFNWGRVIAVGLIGGSISAAAFFGVIFLGFGMTGMSTEETVVENQSSIKSQSYGDSGAHQIDFDSRNISKEEIDNIASGLESSGYYNQQAVSYTYVVNRDKKYELYMAVEQGIEKDEAALQPFKELKSELDKLIPSKKVELNLAVENIQNVVKTIK